MQSNVTQQRVPIHGDPGHWIHVSDSPRHVRVMFDRETIADSKRVKLVREPEVLPAYYFPKLPGASAIKDHFAFEWPKMDKWMEEDEEIFKHARDPYKRVDAMPSRRHVRVVIDGKTVADTRRPHLLFETNHPVRYYIPQEDVRMDMLVSSSTTSRCPYKGPASYWSVKIGSETFPDLVWGYMNPIPECPKIKGLVCFFHERGCDIYVDGELIPQPKTKWAQPLRS